jgi:peptidoglycan-N-acetylmuramic acid deacetylase
MTAVSILALLCLFAVNVSAASLVPGKKYSWYFGKCADGKQPVFDFVDLAELAALDTYAIGSADDKVIYLTFDAGYENGNVRKHLDALDRHGVKGTFFLLSNVLKTHPDLVRSMTDNGHIVANHTMKHRDMTQVTDFEAYKAELRGFDDLFTEVTGKPPSMFYRPPKGEFTKQNLEYNKQLGYKTIFWSLAYLDWDDKKQPSPASAKKKLFERTHPGMVLLLHPTSATNAAIMEDLIVEWKRQGYRFGTLDELTGG